MEIVNQVNQTNDYTIFKTLPGNRNVNKLHVKRLRDSFQKSYLLSPIIVNEKYEIIDGQHRFQAAQQINLPINFLIAKDYGLKEVQMLNENMKNWKKEDYLNAYCDLGNPVYLKFRQFMKQFPDFGIAACETILTDKSSPGHYNKKSKEMISDTNNEGHYAIRYFQEGDLQIPNYKLSIENANKLLMIKPYYEGFNRAVFVRAMIGVFKNEFYNHIKFIERLKASPLSLQHCANVGQTKLLIEEVYNFRSREKVSLRF